MNIHSTSLQSRLGHELSALNPPSSRLKQSSDTPLKTPLTVLRNPPQEESQRGLSPYSPPSSQKTHSSIPFISCSLDQSEEALTRQLTEAMFQVKTAQEQRESFKEYIRSLSFLSIILHPFTQGTYSSVLIQGLPKDEILPTGRMKATFNSEMALYGIGRAAGLKKAQGGEVQDLFALTPVLEEEVHSADLLDPSAIHSEFSAFFCHRNDRKTSVKITEVDELLKALPEPALTLLREPRFQQASPSSPQEWSAPSPALFIKNNRNHLALSTKHLKGIDSESRQVLNTIQQLLKRPSLGKSLALSPGDAFIINNTRCLHGLDTCRKRDRLWLQTLSLHRAQDELSSSPLRSFS